MSVFWNRRSFGMFSGAVLLVGGVWVSSAGAAAPSNDNFVDAVDLGSTSTATATGSTIDATLQAGEPVPSCQVNVAGKTAWWSWTAPASGLVTIDTFGSGFDTVLAVYTGSAVNALSEEGCNDDSGAGLQSEVAFGATGGVEYHIQVDGWSTNSGAVALNVDQAPWRQVGRDIDGEAAEDFSGWSVASSADGATVAVGAIRNDGNGNVAGHVRVFSLVGAAWVQVGGDIDGEAATDFSGISVALSDDGATVAVGAVGNDGNGASAGHVRVFSLVGAAWVQVGGDIDGEAAGDSSGEAVALSADGATVAIGASNNDGNGASAGHVRVYNFSGVAWVQVGGDIDGEAADDRSGEAVALSADGATVAIGAPLNDGTGSSAGHVRVYRFSGAALAWVQVGADIDAEASGDLSGDAVALSADGATVAVGARTNSGNGLNAGHVRVYSSNGAVWVQVGGDIDGEAAGDISGQSVALSADGATVAIGAIRNHGNGTTSRGHVRVYRSVAAGWAQVGGDIDGEAAGDQSGWSVALSADGATVAVGASENDGNGSEAGHVRVHNLDAVIAPAWPDFDGAGDADQSVWRPSVGGWYVHGQATTFLGLNGDVPVPADYDGDGVTDKSVWRPSTGQWFVAGQPTTSLGLSGDVPVPADYDGDGDADRAVWRPSTGQWFVSGQPAVYFGLSTDIPVPADYDGDGDADVAVFRKSVGGWYVKDQATVFFGLSSDVPVPGDFDNDGDADRAIWRPAVGGWYVQGQATVFVGLNGDVPVAADYDGNGTLDRAIWRPSVGGWYVQGQPTVFYGLSTDIPLPIPAAVRQAI